MMIINLPLSKRTNVQHFSAEMASLILNIIQGMFNSTMLTVFYKLSNAYSKKNSRQINDFKNVWYATYFLPPEFSLKLKKYNIYIGDHWFGRFERKKRVK